MAKLDEKVRADGAPTVGNLAARYATGGACPSDVVDEVLRRAAAWPDDRLWISRVPEQTLRARARELDRVLNHVQASVWIEFYVN